MSAQAKLLVEVAEIPIRDLPICGYCGDSVLRFPCTLGTPAGDRIVCRRCFRTVVVFVSMAKDGFFLSMGVRGEDRG